MNLGNEYDFIHAVQSRLLQTEVKSCDTPNLLTKLKIIPLSTFVGSKQPYQELKPTPHRLSDYQRHISPALLLFANLNHFSLIRLPIATIGWNCRPAHASSLSGLGQRNIDLLLIWTGFWFWLICTDELEFGTFLSLTFNHIVVFITLFGTSPPLRHFTRDISPLASCSLAFIYQNGGSVRLISSTDNQ